MSLVISNVTPGRKLNGYISSVSLGSCLVGDVRLCHRYAVSLGSVWGAGG